MLLFSLVPVMLGLSAVGVLAQDQALGPPSTDPACANPPLDQCTFYARCLEPRYQCGPDGYPIRYGQHYCRKFSENRALFDARGQKWLTDTMHCLQVALVGDAIDTTPRASNCEALKGEAFASHPECFVNNGFCTLGLQAWGAVVEVVGDTVSWDGLKQAFVTGGDCAELLAYLAGRGLVEAVARSVPLHDEI